MIQKVEPYREGSIMKEVQGKVYTISGVYWSQEVVFGSNGERVHRFTPRKEETGFFSGFLVKGFHFGEETDGELYDINGLAYLYHLNIVGNDLTFTKRYLHNGRPYLCTFVKDPTTNIYRGRWAYMPEGVPVFLGQATCQLQEALPALFKRPNVFTRASHLS